MLDNHRAVGRRQFRLGDLGLVRFDGLTKRVDISKQLIFACHFFGPKVICHLVCPWRANAARGHCVPDEDAPAVVAQAISNAGATLRQLADGKPRHGPHQRRGGRNGKILPSALSLRRPIRHSPGRCQDSWQSHSWRCLQAGGCKHASIARFFEQFCTACWRRIVFNQRRPFGCGGAAVRPDPGRADHQRPDPGSPHDYLKRGKSTL